jgi:hypothetical protein
MTITLRTSEVRSSCAYHSVAKHVINIIRDPKTPNKSIHAILEKFTAAFNQRHQLQLTIEDMVKIIRSVKHEESGRFAEVFMAPTLRELVHSTSQPLTPDLKISFRNNNAVSGFEEQYAFFIQAYLLNVNILVRCDALAEGSRELSINSSTYVEAFSLNAPKIELKYTCFIKNDDDQSHFETQIPPGMTELSFISMDRKHELYTQYTQCPTPSLPKDDPMIEFTKQWVIQTKSQLAAHNTYRLLQEDQGIAKMFFQKLQDIKESCTTQITKLQPKAQPMDIFRNSALFTTLISTYLSTQAYSLTEQEPKESSAIFSALSASLAILCIPKQELLKSDTQSVKKTHQ